MRSLSRRDFIQLASLSALAGLATACPAPPAPTSTPLPATATAAATSTPLPATLTPVPPTATASPAPQPTVALLRNENRAGFYIRYVNPFPPVDETAWRLQVTGLVDEPATFTVDDVLAFEHTTMNARMKCVECWSVRADWGGFTYRTLADMVRPQPAARFIRLDCADAYWEYLSIEEIDVDRPLFITHLHGEPLEPEYGAPLRMMIPWLYGYKGAKAITGITFMEEGGAGFWSTVGPYTVDGAIEPGRDRALDLEQTFQIDGGEITDH